MSPKSIPLPPSPTALFVQSQLPRATPNVAATSPSRPLIAQYVVRQHLPETQSVLRESATDRRLRDHGRRKPNLGSKGDTSRPTPHAYANPDAQGAEACEDIGLRRLGR